MNYGFIAVYTYTHNKIFCLKATLVEIPKLFHVLFSFSCFLCAQLIYLQKNKTRADSNHGMKEEKSSEKKKELCNLAKKPLRNGSKYVRGYLCKWRANEGAVLKKSISFLTNNNSKNFHTEMKINLMRLNEKRGRRRSVQNIHIHTKKLPQWKKGHFYLQH